MLEEMRDRFVALAEQVAESNKPRVADLNRILELGGSEQRFKPGELCVSDALWALLPVLRRLLERTTN